MKLIRGTNLSWKRKVTTFSAPPPSPSHFMHCTQTDGIDHTVGLWPERGVSDRGKIRARGRTERRPCTELLDEDIKRHSPMTRPPSPGLTFMPSVYGSQIPGRLMLDHCHADRPVSQLVAGYWEIIGRGLFFSDMIIIFSAKKGSLACLPYTIASSLAWGLRFQKSLKTRAGHLGLFLTFL